VNIAAKIDEVENGQMSIKNIFTAIELKLTILYLETAPPIWSIVQYVF
jgi:hypothetical protein